MYCGLVVASPYFLLLLSFKSPETSEMQISRFHDPLLRVFDFWPLEILEGWFVPAIRDESAYGLYLAHCWIRAAGVLRHNLDVRQK